MRLGRGSADGKPVRYTIICVALHQTLGLSLELQTAPTMTWRRLSTDGDEQKLNAQLALGHPDPGMTARYIRSKKGRRKTPLSSKIVEDGP